MTKAFKYKLTDPDIMRAYLGAKAKGLGDSEAYDYALRSIETKLKASERADIAEEKRSSEKSEILFFALDGIVAEIGKVKNEIPYLPIGAGGTKCKNTKWPVFSEVKKSDAEQLQELKRHFAEIGKMTKITKGDARASIPCNMLDAAAFPSKEFVNSFSIIRGTTLQSYKDLNKDDIKEARLLMGGKFHLPKWRNLTDKEIALVCQLVMNQNNNLVHAAFTLNLTPDFANVAYRSKAGFIDYIRNKLNIPYQNWWVIEFVEDKKRDGLRPHIHGAILLPYADFSGYPSIIKNHLTKSLGKIPPRFRNTYDDRSHSDYANDNSMTELQAALSWAANYCFKDHKQSQKLLQCRNFVVDPITKSQAKAFYESMRYQVNNSLINK